MLFWVQTSLDQVEYQFQGNVSNWRRQFSIFVAPRQPSPDPIIICYFTFTFCTFLYISLIVFLHITGSWFPGWGPSPASARAPPMQLNDSPPPAYLWLPDLSIFFVCVFRIFMSDKKLMDMESFNAVPPSCEVWPSISISSILFVNTNRGLLQLQWYLSFIF